MSAQLVYLAIMVGSSLMSRNQEKKAADLKREQMQQQKLQQRIAASDATINRLSQMSKSIASQQISAAAMGLSPLSTEQQVYDEAQAASDDIKAINFNLESYEAQQRIAKAEMKSEGKMNDLGRGLDLAGSIFDMLRLGT